jgi:hypothetical protein
MTDIHEIHNKLYESTYCICAPTRKLYLFFFKELINKYLADIKNYDIYVSTTDQLLPLYKSTWPSHPRLLYISDGLVPTTIPNNINCIYFYHQKIKPSKEGQIALVNYIDSTPLIKYVYVGMVSQLLSFVRTKLFRYYLHFEIKYRHWGCLQTGGIGHNQGRSICRQYYNQNNKKKKANGTITTYDFFLMHDNFMEETEIIKFNKKIIKKKKPIPVPKNKPVVVDNNNSKTVDPNPQIKYIYTGVRHNTNSLIMPNGSTENYQNVVNKYQDIIEI